VASERNDPDYDTGELIEDDESKDDEQEDGDGDPELAALLQMNSDISSSSESEVELTRQEEVKPKRMRLKGRYGYEMPASTIAVLIVGCWTLRIPVICRDFIRCVASFLKIMVMTS
jgi:RNA polymerase I-specific transcription initiation factor RRN7